MRTQLSQFCEQFVSTVQPVLAPLDRAIAAAGGEASAAGTAVSSGLAELRGQLQLLCDKVAKQRAYVLIFGPLKSGKSTLMNSIAGSYVSEVSSLPAYPSLVFVSHADQPQFVVTSYDGEARTCADADGLTGIIDVAHGELAAAIRQAESAGEQFDPQQHFPQAIRRVDVRIAATNLKESGAVLVDTPGLYTRMRFGYDRMTRDFRHAAACAIFVVKSDTLFLEQVFTEFNQLLDLFSRIFLVINMDTTKRDVGPDGTLVPSMEQKDPDRIVAAFENLAMPAALREARDAGRLRIFPVDLMRAASRTLQGKDVGGTDFGRFRDDLAAYLASTDYLTAFLSDSLKRATHLVSDTAASAEGTFTAALRHELAVDAEQRAGMEEELQWLADCQKLDWTPAFARFESELKERLDRGSHDVGSRIARDMSAALETWMLSSHSLEWLFATAWRPLCRAYVQSVRDTGERCFEQSVYQNNAGLDCDQSLLAFLHGIDIDFRPLRLAAHAELANDADTPLAIPLRIADIPLRRGVVDVLTLRSEDKVRQRLFGADGSNKITPRQKATRLGEPAKKFLNHSLLQFRNEFFPETVAAAHERYGARLRRATITRLKESLSARTPDLERAVANSKQRARDIQRVLTPIEELRNTAERVVAAVDELHVRFAATEAQAILQPVPPGEGKASPRGARSKRERSR